MANVPVKHIPLSIICIVAPSSAFVAYRFVVYDCLLLYFRPSCEFEFRHSCLTAGNGPK